MSIGLSVRRPEAAIADPSRLIIEDIYPTYVSSEGFLDAAKFKLENGGPDSIGGFKVQASKKPAPVEPKMDAPQAEHDKYAADLQKYT
jgi:hypothetical protein